MEVLSERVGILLSESTCDFWVSIVKIYAGLLNFGFVAFFWGGNLNIEFHKRGKEGRSHCFIIFPKSKFCLFSYTSFHCFLQSFFIYHLLQLQDEDPNFKK